MSDVLLYQVPGYDGRRHVMLYQVPGGDGRRHSQVREKRLLSREEVYDGALEDILCGKLLHLSDTLFVLGFAL